MVAFCDAINPLVTALPFIHTGLKPGVNEMASRSSTYRRVFDS
jgi:hypothetical protein